MFSNIFLNMINLNFIGLQVMPLNYKQRGEKLNEINRNNSQSRRIRSGGNSRRVKKYPWYSRKKPLEIFVEGEKVILQKYRAGEGCTIIGEVSEHKISLANGKIRGYRVLDEGIAAIRSEIKNTYLYKRGAISSLLYRYYIDLILQPLLDFSPL